VFNRAYNKGVQGIIKKCLGGLTSLGLGLLVGCSSGQSPLAQNGQCVIKALAKSTPGLVERVRTECPKDLLCFYEIYTRDRASASTEPRVVQGISFSPFVYDTSRGLPAGASEKNFAEEARCFDSRAANGGHWVYGTPEQVLEKMDCGS
jgi:hypothetical protein